MKDIQIAAFVLLIPIVWAGAPQAFAGDSGYYLSGKGGPTYLTVGGFQASSGGALHDTSAANMVGAFGMAAGYTWAKQGIPLRTELEFMNRTEVTHDSSPLFSVGGTNFGVASTVQNVSAMLKAYWYLPYGDPNRMSPFVSAGAGVSRNAVRGDLTPIATGGSTVNFNKASLHPAWTAGAGVSLYLGNNVVNDIELRYVDLGSADWGIPGSVNLHASTIRGAEVSFALRYNF